MSKFNYNFELSFTEPLSRGDLKEVAETVERALGGSDARWEPEDYDGEAPKLWMYPIAMDLTDDDED